MCFVLPYSGILLVPKRSRDSVSGDVSFRRPAVELLVVTMHSRAEAQFGRELLAEAQFDELWAETLLGRDYPPVVGRTPVNFDLTRSSGDVRVLV